jgi:hypothetical protein
MLDKDEHLRIVENNEAIDENAKAGIRNEAGSNTFVEPDSAELESLESEIGLEKVPLDQAVIDTIAVDNTDDNLDADDDDVMDDSDNEEIISDLPQERTESYGTGLQGKPSDRAGKFSRRSDDHFNNNDADPILTGGDVDANYEQASAVGDEAVGGTVDTPDQDIVEELAAAMGVEIDDYTDVRINDLLKERDDRRWELDPKSSEDYPERRN